MYCYNIFTRNNTLISNVSKAIAAGPGVTGPVIGCLKTYRIRAIICKTDDMSTLFTPTAILFETVKNGFPIRGANFRYSQSELSTVEAISGG